MGWVKAGTGKGFRVWSADAGLGMGIKKLSHKTLSNFLTSSFTPLSVSKVFFLDWDI